MLESQHKSVKIIEIMGEIALSILVHFLQGCSYGGLIGMALGWAFESFLWLFFRKYVAANILENIWLWTSAVGFIVGGLMGLISEILNIRRSKWIHNLWIYLMIGLGISHPSGYEHTRQNIEVEFGVKRFCLRVCFWISYWAILGTIVGGIGGALFGLFGFEASSMEEAMIQALLWLKIWALFGAICGIIFGPMGWLGMQINKRSTAVTYSRRFYANRQFYVEVPFWLVGGKMGQKLFDKLFGDRIQGR